MAGARVVHHPAPGRFTFLRIKTEVIFCLTLTVKQKEVASYEEGRSSGEGG